MAIAEAWNPDRARDIVAAHLHREGPLLPILHDLQAAFGSLSDEAVALVAQELNLSRADVHGVVTFYHDFRRVPAGRHVIKLCQAEACQARGAAALTAHAQDRLAAALGETTADDRFTLEPVYCLGLCASGPAAMIDGKLAARLTNARLDALLAQAR